MIQLTEKGMSKAIAKARKEKPFVRVTAWRRYTVTNKSTGATYTVTFDVINGQRFASCDCACGQAGKFICYHIASCTGAHLMIAEARRKAA
jgi:hypothetical protein